MASLCYNKGCGQRFDPEHNASDSCLYHPGVPIFHDALKGWSCCKKRTTDFSEFLSIKGCTKGFHSKEKPPEPFSQGETSDNQKAKPVEELIVQGPKSAEKMQRERPSSDEPRQLLPIKVSRSLEQALEKLNLSSKDKALEGSCASSGELMDGVGIAEGETTAQVRVGTTCKNAACKVVYQGPESNTEVCTFHPGVPVFHEGVKYWSCCGVRTTDFSTFLEQPGCSRGRHCWAGKAVIEIEKSFVSMVPTKVEITLCKTSCGSWASLELPQSRSHSCGEQKAASTKEPRAVQEEDSDDNLSWSEDDEEELEMAIPSN
ncbi:integrin beta-1-binding protein 2 isoform X4 [Lathamus discolor]|uniref:integrin beta-1-binding protein 2 isoform X4 n=1 Tax=Lathamus discolor TaxID=678569 RepID=UPI0032B6FB58